MAGLLAAVAMSLLLVPLLATPASAASQVGTVTSSKIDQYCQGAGGAVLTANNAYGWRCRNGSGVDMDRLCSQAGAYRWGRVANFYDPQSWQCWTGARYANSSLTGSDFSAFCRRYGYSGAASGADAYSWRCTSPNRSDTFAVINVCYWKMNRPGVIDRFTNFYNPNSWECRV